MAVPVPERIAAAANQRIGAAEGEIRHSLDRIRTGQPLLAEPEPERRIQRVATVAKVGLETARRIADYQEPASLGLAGESLAKAEAIQGKTVDYLGVAWLDAGRIASRAVARILFGNGQANGTGFLVSDRLLLTNNHVIPTANMARGLTAEFRYELGLGQRAPVPVHFTLDPDTFFETDDEDDLDYTLIALGRSVTVGADLTEFGSCPLGSSASKHSVGEPVNLVQHPDGDYKQVVIRENRILHRGDHVLHYLADTEPGASGSPVFNDQWQVVALHHWGSPHREVSANGQALSRAVNEGVRISAIVTELEERAARMTEAQRTMLRQALNASPPSEFGTRVVDLGPAPGPQAIRRTFTVPPLMAPVALPSTGGGYTPSGTPTSSTTARSGGEAGGGAPANRIDRRYSNRRGYNERFLSGFNIPMPQLNARQRSEAARVSGVGDSGNPFELRFEHFSVVLNADRRMAFYSICNIDGAKRIIVNRDTGQAVSGPEATESWALDPRVPEEAQLSDAFYARLRRDLRTTDFFARGHLTRREDPNWGTAVPAERANDDTYHHPNGCPQVQNAFNGSQRAWQGIENFILNSTDDANLRVTVITGPVFRDDDPVYDDEEFGPTRLPRRFWKILARVEDGEKRVFAVLADQSEVMDLLFAAGPESREAAFNWPKNLSKEFRSTVDEIAELTGLDFGDLATFDEFAGGGESLADRELLSAEELFPRPSTEGSFGRFDSIGGFLDAWEDSLRPGREGARPPQPRERRVVEVETRVARLFADDLSGAKHQHFSVVLTKVLAASERGKPDVETTRKGNLEVRLAVRFGDSRGLADRIPGIRTGLPLRLKGEWIPADEAFAVGGARMAVLHFTHDPLGFVCTPEECFS